MKYNKVIACDDVVYKTAERKALRKYSLQKENSSLAFIEAVH